MAQKRLRTRLPCTWPSWPQLSLRASRFDNVDYPLVGMGGLSPLDHTSYSRSWACHSENALTYVSRPKKTIRERTNKPYMEPIPYAHLQLTHRLLSEQHIRIRGNRPCSSYEKSKCERREEGRDDETHSPDVKLSKSCEMINNWDHEFLPTILAWRWKGYMSVTI